MAKFKKTNNIHNERKEKITQRETAADKLISMIFGVFEVSKKEIPVCKVKVENPKYGIPVFNCKIAFSKESEDYYYRSCEDSYYPNTSEQLLRGKEKVIKNTPMIINKLIYFENTLLPECTGDEAYEKLKIMNLQNYQVIKNEKGFEVVSNI